MKTEYYEENFDFDEIDAEPVLEDALINDEDFVKKFSGDLDRFVSECIVNFFQDKEMHCGGPIPTKMITSDNYIKMVARSDNCLDVDEAYRRLKNYGIKCETENENLISDDVKLVLQIIKKCKKAKIPKCFRGGLILMYLEFCEGVV